MGRLTIKIHILGLHFGLFCSSCEQEKLIRIFIDYLIIQHVSPIYIISPNIVKLLKNNLNHFVIQSHTSYIPVMSLVTDQSQGTTIQII